MRSSTWSISSWLVVQMAVVGAISAEIALQLQSAFADVFTNAIVSRLLIWLATALLTILLTVNLRHGIQQLIALVEGQQQTDGPQLTWPLSNLVEQLSKQLRSKFDVSQVRGAAAQQVREAAAQAERNRLARDLHDSIKQQIFSINIYAATAEARLNSDPAGALEAIERVQQSTSESLDEMDALLIQLRPIALDRLGLVEALRELCTATGYRTGAVVTLDIDDLPADDQFDVGAQETIYRIVQEALSNAARHARAQAITVSLQVALPQPTSPQLNLTVSDDGQGFDKTSAKFGMGMETMRSRADQLGGQFSIASADTGTVVSITGIPLLQKVASSRSQLRWFDAVSFVGTQATAHVIRNAIWVSTVGFFALPFAAFRLEVNDPLPLLALLMGLLAITAFLSFRAGRQVTNPTQQSDSMGIALIQAHVTRLNAWLHIEVGLLAGTIIYAMSALTTTPWRYAYPLALLAFGVMALCLIGGLRRWYQSAVIEHQLAWASADSPRLDAIVSLIKQSTFASLGMSIVFILGWAFLNPVRYDNYLFGVQTTQWHEWLNLCVVGLVMVIWLLQNGRLLNMLRFPESATRSATEAPLRDET